MLVDQGEEAVFVRLRGLDDALGRMDQLQVVLVTFIIVRAPDPPEGAGDLLKDVQVLELILEQRVDDAVGVLEPERTAVGQPTGLASTNCPFRPKSRWTLR